MGGNGEGVTPRFDPISRRTVAEEVRERLQRSIETGQLKPGERLPSERTLCDDFGVARTSVREAIQGLASLGFIERRGNRAYVTEQLPDLQVSLDQRENRVREVFEVRRLIEVPMVAMVAERALPAERAEIERISQTFRKTMPLPAFRSLDRDFHWAVARASHNTVLAELYLKVLEGLFESDTFASLLFDAPTKAAAGRIIAESVEAHHAIARGIVQGDPVAAVAAVERHLRQVADRIGPHPHHPRSTPA